MRSLEKTPNNVHDQNEPAICIRDGTCRELSSGLRQRFQDKDNLHFTMNMSVTCGLCKNQSIHQKTTIAFHTRVEIIIKWISVPWLVRMTSRHQKFKLTNIFQKIVSRKSTPILNVL